MSANEPESDWGFMFLLMQPKIALLRGVFLFAPTLWPQWRIPFTLLVIAGLVQLVSA